MRSAGILGVLLVAAGCGGSSSSPDGGTADMAAPDGGTSKLLTILYTNDEHSHILAFAPEVDDFPPATAAGTGPLKGGVARRMTLLKQERAAAATRGAATLTLSAGDNVMGTLPQVGFAQTAPDFSLMSTMGYDVTCLGNHEFDYGPTNLAKALQVAHDAKAQVPTVATNIHFSSTDAGDDMLAAGYSDTPDPSKLVEKYHIVTTSNGLKIGFIGILGSDAAYVEPWKAPVHFSLGASGKESNYDEVRQAIYADVQPTVDKLRNDEKVDLVIALDHAGLDLQTPTNGDDYLIAQNVSGIDVIISGHTHTVVPQPIVVEHNATKNNTIIVQAGAFGVYVGRLDLTVDDSGISFDTNSSKLLPVDESITPDPGMITMAEVQMVRDLEGQPFGSSGKSFIEGALGRILGMTVTDDKSKDGDLYFYTLGKTDFDITGDSNTDTKEVEVLDLSADATLAAADKYATDPTDVGIQALGVIRGNLPKGKTGNLSFADVFRILPLGLSPADHSIGYPLSRSYLSFYEIKAAFELVASIGLTQSSEYLVASGMRVTFDTSRPPLDLSNPANVFDPTKGRITKIEWSSNHTKNGVENFDLVLFDINRADPWTEPNTGRSFQTPLYAVATNAYIASFAASAGVTLKDKSGNPLSLAQTIVHRGDGSEVKDFEALGEFIVAQSAANSGKMPSRYDSTTQEGHVPRRMICSGPLCM